MASSRVSVGAGDDPMFEAPVSLATSIEEFLGQD